MPCPRCNALQEIAEATRRARETRSFFANHSGPNDATPQQLEEDADLAIFKAELDLIEHKKSCEECKRGYAASL